MTKPITPSEVANRQLPPPLSIDDAIIITINELIAQHADAYGRASFPVKTIRERAIVRRPLTYSQVGEISRIPLPFEFVAKVFQPAGWKVIQLGSDDPEFSFWPSGQTGGLKELISSPEVEIQCRV